MSRLGPVVRKWRSQDPQPSLSDSQISQATGLWVWFVCVSVCIKVRCVFTHTQSWKPSIQRWMCCEVEWECRYVCSVGLWLLCVGVGVFGYVCKVFGVLVGAGKDMSVYWVGSVCWEDKIGIRLVCVCVFLYWILIWNLLKELLKLNKGFSNHL